MPTAVRPESGRTHSREPSFMSLLSGWAQQGVQRLFASEGIIVDIAMGQNASLMHALAQKASDPPHSPTAILSEIGGQGINNLLEGHKVLLGLAQEHNE